MPGGWGRVTITALPRRTAARYHHRCPPVVIGDASYALALLCSGLAGLGLDHSLRVGCTMRLAHQIGLPESERWAEVWPGSAAEVALAAVDVHLPGAAAQGPAHGGEPAGQAEPLEDGTPCPPWVPGPDDLGVRGAVEVIGFSPAPLHLVLLTRRRSPSPARLALGPNGTPARKLPETGTAHGMEPLGPWAAGQHWIDDCPDVVLLHAAPAPSDQWACHLRAAELLVEALAGGRQARPVSGWTHSDVHGMVSHALVREGSR